MKMTYKHDELDEEPSEEKDSVQSWADLDNLTAEDMTQSDFDFWHPHFD